MAEQRTAEGKANKHEYIREYNKTAYDRINVMVPKGTRQPFKDYAAAHNLSLAGLVVIAIEEYMKNHA